MSRDRLDQLDQVVALLRRALAIGGAGATPELTSELVELAMAHKVTWALDRRAPGGAPDRGTAALLLVRRSTMTRHSLQQRMALRGLVEAFDAAGVPFVAFKGAALAAQTGRRPEERPGVDIDLLILPTDWERAHRILLGLGFSLVGTPPPGPDQRTSYVVWSYNEAAYQRASIAVDLHWRMTMGHDPAMSTEALLAERVHVELDGVRLPTLHPDAALAHVALHGAKDRWRLLRSVVDAHLLLGHGASWAGAARFLPRGTSLDECRAGVAFLTSDRELPDPATVADQAERAWIGGLLGRSGVRDDGRLADGTLPFLVSQVRLTPGLDSALAIGANSLLPPSALTSPLLPARWWLLGIPLRLGRLVRRRLVILGRWLGLPLAPPRIG